MVVCIIRLSIRIVISHENTIHNVYNNNNNMYLFIVQYAMYIEVRVHCMQEATYKNILSYL